LALAASRFALCALLLSPLILTASAAPATMLIPANGPWKYLDAGNIAPTSTTTPIDNTDWRHPDFTSLWPSGNAELGYGDGGETTTVHYVTDGSGNKNITTYFRHTFTVADPTLYETLNLSLLYDDGAVIYLNGTEIYRIGMPSGDITPTTFANVTIGDAAETTWTGPISLPNTLIAGNNVLAVEIHQVSPTSSDISFNLELLGIEPVIPPNGSVTLLTPADNIAISTPNPTFSANLTDDDGLVSATLELTDYTELTLEGTTDIDDAQITDGITANTGSALSINVDAETPELKEARALIRINGLSAIPQNATILSATLELAVNDAGSAMTAALVTTPWSEDTVSWSSAPAYDSNNTLPANGTTIGINTIDITPWVQNWVTAPGYNYGLILLPTGTDGVDFPSSETTSGPTLHVQYVTSAITQTIDLTDGGNTTHPTSTTVSFDNLTLTDGSIYSWTIYATDTLGNTTYPATPRTLTYDTQYPHIPTLTEPADATTDTSLTPTLTAEVADPSTSDTLTVTFYGRPTIGSSQPPFSIIALPDSQKYVASSDPAINKLWTDQTTWISQNASSLNIQFVTHEGDIVDDVNNTTHWSRAEAGIATLDAAGIPYGIAPGNHDVSGGTYDDASVFNSHFPYSGYTSRPWYLDNYPSTGNEHSAQIFSVGPYNFLAVHLKIWPKSDAINWARDLFNAYPNHIGLLTTHGYLGLSAERNVHVVGDTTYIWSDLITQTPNVQLVFCGHVHGEARRTDFTSNRAVHQMLADYQTLPDGGHGYLRILQFIPNENRIQVYTYSPTHLEYQHDADSEFSLPIPLHPYTTIGTSTVATSANTPVTVSVTWPNLTIGTQYEWFVAVTDSTDRQTLSPTYTFTTTANDLTPPILSSIQIIPTDTSATIIWTTDEPASSSVTCNSTTVSDPTLTTSHSITLTDLTHNTTYGITITSADANLNSASLPDTFTTLALNSPPTATDFSITTDEDTTATIQLLGTDIDPNPLTYDIVTPPSLGTLSNLNPNSGSLTYTPNLNANGDDFFTYSVSDGLATTTATVSLTITAVNDAPTTPTDLTPTPGLGTITLNWSASTDPDPDPITYYVYRTTPPNPYPDYPVGIVTSPTFTDTPPTTDTHTYIVRAIDPENAYADSIEVSATPTPSNPNAYVTANPTITTGVLTGDYTALAALDGTTQILTEGVTGNTRSLLAEYTLQTPADPTTLTSAELVLAASPTSSWDDNYSIQLWTGSDWSTATAHDDVLTILQANNGQLHIRITDTAAIKRENADSLAIDVLYVACTVPASPDANQPPVIATFSATPSGNTITLSATASDPDSNDSVSTVIFQIVDSLGSVQSAQYVGSDDTLMTTFTALADGIYSCVALAVDTTGAATASTPLTVTIGDVPNTPPAITLTSPTDNSTHTVNSPVPLTATASDPDGSVTSVEFFANGGSVGPVESDGSSTFTTTWTPSTDGTYSITATATDNLGATTTTPLIAVTIEAAPPPPTTPTVAFSNPHPIEKGKNTSAEITVQVLNANTTPAASATVNATCYINGTTLLTASSGITDTSGILTLTSTPVKTSDVSTFTLTIDSITIDSTTFNINLTSDPIAP
jgi:hypothetical protein